jgi:hypothetical protein
VRPILQLCAAGALAAVAAAGCDAGFEKQSIVLDLRALAAQANPPEVVLDIDVMDPDSFEQLSIPPITVTALYADPGEARRLEWIMTACPPTRSLRCDDPTAPYIAVDFGSIDDPEDAGSQGISGTFTATPAVLQESLRLDDAALLGGIGVQIEIVVFPAGDPDLSRAVFASKKVLYSPRLPAARVANSNPPLPELTVHGARCGDPLEPPWQVRAGDELTIMVTEPEGARETYQLPTFDGSVRTITENLSYQWYATAGSFSAEMTGGPLDPFGNEPALLSKWTAPNDPGEVRFWLVVRDERGGVSWLERCFAVQP